MEKEKSQAGLESEEKYKEFFRLIWGGLLRVLGLEIDYVRIKPN